MKPRFADVRVAVGRSQMVGHTSLLLSSIAAAATFGRRRSSSSASSSTSIAGNPQGGRRRSVDVNVAQAALLADGPPTGALLILQVCSSRASTQQRVILSMKAIGQLADWAIILYDGSDASSWSAASRLAKRLPTGFEVRTGSRPDSAHEILGRKFYPKLQFWLQAMDHIAHHEYTFFADEDISFVGFDLASYWRRVHTAFSRGVPLVSQPVTHSPVAKTSNESTGKWEQFFNTDGFWRGSRVVAAESSFVEQQVTMVNSRFFVSARKGWETLAMAQHREGSDFGLDSAWCGAASLYAPRGVACAIVPVAIVHDNTRSLNWTADATFWTRSMRLTKLARETLVPEWWQQSVKLMGEFRRRETGGEKNVLAARRAALGTCLGWSSANEVRVTCVEHVALTANASRLRRPKHMLRMTGKVPCETAKMDCFPKCHTHFSEIAWCQSRGRGAAGPGETK